MQVPWDYVSLHLIEMFHVRLESMPVILVPWFALLQDLKNLDRIRLYQELTKDIKGVSDFGNALLNIVILFQYAEHTLRNPGLYKILVYSKHVDHKVQKLFVLFTQHIRVFQVWK